MMKDPAPAFRRFASTTRTSIHEYWSAGLSFRSAVLFAFTVSFAWLALYNARFWEETVDAMWHGNAASVLFLASLFVLALCLQSMLVLLVPRRLLKVTTSLLFVVAAFGSYFSAKYGIVMNKEMMRNVWQTDATEAGGLISVQLIQWVLLLGVVPAAFIWKVRLPAIDWRRSLKQRCGAIAGILAVSAVALFSCASSYAVYFREHKPIRFTLSPAAPLSSAIQFFADQRNDSARGPAINVSGAAVREGPVRAKPLLMLIVVGETARAADFQLGGYARATNPRLAAENGLVYFGQATSCGTATAISVPCMFSHLRRDGFDVDEASRYMNLLDALAESGFDVEWRDNNAGCKGVCARVREISYADRKDPRLCERDYCYDEILLDGMQEKLRSLQHDTVIVMHMIGSHGPAYARRYPAQFETFTPACHSNELQRCNGQEILNAYDNTILYTDYVLAQAIDELRAASDRVDSVLLYASDHGESLGEQGVYLHGLPYRFAPQTQKQVPMLLWTSDGYAAERRLDARCLQSRAKQAVSHDNLYHTVLGAAQVRNASYDAGLDLISHCAEPLPASRE